MGDGWLGDVAIRVTDLERSLRFYRELLDLEELVRESEADSACVLLRDRRSGQRLEFNWYSEDNPFWSPYVPGEGLDHLEIRVRSVPETLARLQSRGIVPVNRSMWTNARSRAKYRNDPRFQSLYGAEIWTTPNGHRIAYVQDPDGLFVCLYDHPEEPWDGPIPPHY